MNIPQASRPRTAGLAGLPRFAALGTLALTLGACASDLDERPDVAEASQPTVTIDPEPVSIQAPAQEANLDEVQLPVHLNDLISVDPQWDTPPQVHDGVFLAPGEQDEKLEFSAVAADGTQLWTAHRPLSCTGFALTSAGDRSLAVLTDLDTEEASEDSLGATTATAYDLHTGEEVWGPVEVPGPHQGPGLVFAAGGDEPLGGTGQRVALDAATGERSVEGAAVVGEFFGTWVLVQDGDLIASTRGGSEELWRTPLPAELAGLDADEIVSPATNRLPPDSALIGTPEGGYGLWDLEAGEPLAEELDTAMFDAMGNTWVAVREEQLVGVDPQGEQLWSADLDADAELLGAGGVMAYVLLQGEGLDIYNTVTGNAARVYDPLDEGATAVPLAFTDSGATVVDTGTDLLLVSDVPRPAGDYDEEPDPLETGP